MRLGSPATYSSLVLAAIAVGAASCATSPAAPTQQPHPSPRTDLIQGVRVSRDCFNPQAGEEVHISYTLTTKATVTARIYDPDFGLVRVLPIPGLQDQGLHSLSWDGKDQDAILVPDEAYLLTLTAEDGSGGTQLYDPTVFSGGRVADLSQADLDPETGTLTYRLAVSSRVLIRLGIQDGPLLNTLVDWKPRLAGEVTEPWNGRDQDDLFDLAGHPRFRMLITSFDLPENSVITYGNHALDYRHYKAHLAANRPIKDRPRRAGVAISPHYLLARSMDYSPGASVTFGASTGQPTAEPPVLKGRTLVRVDVAEADRCFFMNQQYEITFFVDGEFFAEQEIGYAPLNWVWDLSGVKEGPHILTVNLSGFKDQMAVLSKKVLVAR
jgi:hypothetical protein